MNRAPFASTPTTPGVGGGLLASFAQQHQRQAHHGSRFRARHGILLAAAVLGVAAALRLVTAPEGPIVSPAPAPAEVAPPKVERPAAPAPSAAPSAVASSPKRAAPAPSTTAVASSPDPPAPSPKASRKPRVARLAAAPRSTASAPSSRWRSLALEGKFAEAIAAAEGSGFEDLCARGSAAELFALGEAARLSGNDGRAQTAYESLRRRHSQDGRAAVAAFMLGRIAAETRGDPAQAAGWFAMALREQPDGPFAQDALGRLMEAKQKAGDASGAEDAAQRYLARYPTGPRAAAARSLAKVDP